MSLTLKGKKLTLSNFNKIKKKNISTLTNHQNTNEISKIKNNIILT